jgi:hypothetical protein
VKGRVNAGLENGGRKFVGNTSVRNSD